MFKSIQDKPFVFNDGSKLTSFRHDEVALDVFHDDQNVAAFAFLWPVAKMPGKTMQFSWHRDHGFASGIATPSFDRDIGHFERNKVVEPEALAALLENEGMAIPAIFREEIISVLRGADQK